jgi:hypothetical protein
VTSVFFVNCMAQGDGGLGSHMAGALAAESLEGAEATGALKASELFWREFSTGLGASPGLGGAGAGTPPVGWELLIMVFRTFQWTPVGVGVRC